MPFNRQLAARVRAILKSLPHLSIEEKKMFGGLAFKVNDKMCINVSKDRLMCRFDPNITDELISRKGFEPMRMKGRVYKGFCYVAPEGYTEEKDLLFWINICLEFNDRAKPSKKK